MKDNVIKMYPSTYADNPDNILQEAVGQYEDVLILGWDSNGSLDARATRGLTDGGDLLWILENFKWKLLNGDYRSD